MEKIDTFTATTKERGQGSYAEALVALMRDMWNLNPNCHMLMHYVDNDVYEEVCKLLTPEERSRVAWEWRETPRPLRSEEPFIKNFKGQPPWEPDPVLLVYDNLLLAIADCKA